MHRGVEVALALPCLGDGHRHRVADVAAAADEQLDDGVELARVGVVVVDHRVEQLLRAEARGLGTEHGACPHAVHVARDRVDLAVVAQHAERLRPLPRREGVRREALVEHDERGGEALVGEVVVEAWQRIGCHQALVGDRAERARRHVDASGRCVDPATEAKGGPFVGALGVEHRLHDARPRGQGLVTELAVARRRLTPLDDAQVLGGRRGLDRLAGVVAAHEEHGDAVARAEDGRGDGKQHSGAVGRLRVGCDRTPVTHARQPVEGCLDDRAGRPAVGVRDEADATGVELRAQLSPRERSVGSGLSITAGALPR